MICCGSGLVCLYFYTLRVALEQILVRLIYRGIAVTAAEDEHPLEKLTVTFVAAVMIFTGL